MSGRITSKILCALAVSILLPATAVASSLSVMIDQAGLQRMLTQRIVKAYAQVMIDIDPAESRVQLEEAVSLFGEQLGVLEQQAPDGNVRTALSRVRRLWNDFEPIATGPVNREGMALLLELDGELLSAAHKVVLRLQEASGTAQAKLVNTAGRQRMLSQRIAKLYMLISSGMQNADLSEQLQHARYEFEGALAHLEATPENTPEIQQGLAEVERQWIIFRTSFQLQEGEYIPLLVALAAEKILEQMNRVTAMYAQLGDIKPPSPSEKGRGFGVVLLPPGHNGRFPGGAASNG